MLFTGLVYDYPPSSRLVFTDPMRGRKRIAPEYGLSVTYFFKFGVWGRQKLDDGWPTIQERFENLPRPAFGASATARGLRPEIANLDLISAVFGAIPLPAHRHAPAPEPLTPQTERRQQFPLACGYFSRALV